MTRQLTPEECAAFHRDGFVLIPDLYSEREIAVLRAHIEGSEELKSSAWGLADGEGRASRLALWGNVSRDALGLVSAAPRVVDNVERLLGEPVYHWHSKVMLKEPRVGGAWEWHQDYGYWYHDGCPFPQMVSCMLSIDASTRENGCLQVLVGSHRLGRIEHMQVGTQTGADPQRVAALRERLAHRYVETEPGAMLFFHCNLLHASDANLSDRPRRALICCYNALSNTPLYGQGHGAPVPIERCAEDALLQLAAGESKKA